MALTIISWCQVEDVVGQSFEEQSPPVSCSDDELVGFLREVNSEEEDPDGAWGMDWRGRTNTWSWCCVSVSRGEKTATVEWRSSRNHLAVTTVIW